MQLFSRRLNLRAVLGLCLMILAALVACERTAQPDGSSEWSVSGIGKPSSNTGYTGDSLASLLPPTRVPGAPVLTPTPDPPHDLPALRQEASSHVVQPSETLGRIAQQYGVSLQDLVQANDIANPDLVAVGQNLTIPAPTPEGRGPSFKIIPDSELVNGPASALFDIDGFIQSKGGYLAHYTQDIDGKTYTGAQIVERVARNYSVNPRLLLAVLQYQSHWLTEANPGEGTLEIPIGLQNNNQKGLYRQLAWAANTLNRGFYLWRVNAVASWLLGDGSVLPIDNTINAGTAAVQHFFSLFYAQQDWQQVVSEGGFFQTYSALFGYPFDLAVEPLLPADLEQPELQLPFEAGEAWSFTGGPHAGWDSGSAWAALDFAPPSDVLGCVSSDSWVVAAADGVIIRTGEGQVIQDLDGDGYEQTGWVLLYMHIESRDRVEPGTALMAGEHIGHPSCEGGVSTGTHVHLARKYNGEWIPADQSLPFVLDGWVSHGLGNEYDGTLDRSGQSIEAYAGSIPDNVIQR